MKFSLHAWSFEEMLNSCQGTSIATWVCDIQAEDCLAAFLSHTNSTLKTLINSCEINCNNQPFIYKNSLFIPDITGNNIITAVVPTHLNIKNEEVVELLSEGIDSWYKLVLSNFSTHQ